MNRIIFPIFILAIWLIGGSWWFAKNYCGPAPVVVENKISSAFLLSSGGFSIKSGQNFSFALSGSELFIPDQTAQALQKLAGHLKQNPDTQLQLTGNYLESEQNNSDQADLGLARAESMKRQLVNWGADSTQITTNSAIQNSLQLIDENNIAGGVNFLFTDKIQPLTLYFPVSEYKLELNDELRAYFSKLLNYIENNPETKIYITGHSDNTGKQEGNIRLSKYRARKVRDFFVDNGIPVSKIVLSYKGSDEPIASNDTPEGQEKNRRVEIEVL